MELRTKVLIYITIGMAIAVMFMFIQMWTSPKIVNAQFSPQGFGEPVSLTSTSTWQECHYFNPRTFDYATTTTKQDVWQYADATCTDPTIQNIIQGTSSFYIDKTWSYGDLLIAFLLVIVIFFLIFLLIFSFFFEPVLKIRGRK